MDKVQLTDFYPRTAYMVEAMHLMLSLLDFLHPFGDPGTSDGQHKKVNPAHLYVCDLCEPTSISSPAHIECLPRHCSDHRLSAGAQGQGPVKLADIDAISPSSRVVGVHERLQCTGATGQ